MYILNKLWITDKNLNVVHNISMKPRFYTLTDISEILNISMSAARSLVTSGELPAIQIGGKQAWRIEVSELESFIQRQYQLTRERIDAGNLS